MFTEPFATLGCVATAGTIRCPTNFVRAAGSLGVRLGHVSRLQVTKAKKVIVSCFEHYTFGRVI